MDVPQGRRKHYLLKNSSAESGEIILLSDMSVKVRWCFGVIVTIIACCGTINPKMQLALQKNASCTEGDYILPKIGKYVRGYVRRLCPGEIMSRGVCPTLDDVREDDEDQAERNNSNENFNILFRKLKCLFSRILTDTCMTILWDNISGPVKI